MRSAASRRGLFLLALAVVLSGCTSATKKHYLKHLSTTIAPVSVDAEPMAAAGESGSAVAAVNRDDRSPR
jgi:predicted component of type VI protein secretion system